MKILITLLTLFSFNAYSKSQAFYTELNGTRFYCAPIDDSSRSDGDIIDCIEKAYAGPFSRTDAEILCKGASSTGPADCAIKAYKGSLLNSEAVAFCTGALSQGPADCLELAYAGPFSKSESLELCGSPIASSVTANCAIKAYSGSYSKSESIRICKNQAIVTSWSSSKISKDLKFIDPKMKFNKAIEQLAVAKEKMRDAQIKIYQDALDGRLK